MVPILFHTLREFRPRQWIKNLSLYAALVFSGFFFQSGYFIHVTIAFVIFCLLSSAIYIVNDIVDAPADRQHPFKKKRPIASGALPMSFAQGIAGGLFALVLTLAIMTGSVFFVVIVVAYAALHIWYTFTLKHIAILDVMTIATGFILRVYAGAVIVNLHMSVWFLLTVISASLFLAVAKRQSERTLMKGTGKELRETRETLEHYSQRLLDVYAGMFATATWLTYALYTFQRDEFSPEGRLVKYFALLPKTFTSQKWLMVTVPLVIYGVMRYLQLAYEQNEGESPERVILRDKALLITGIAWGSLVMMLLYGLG
ncbi:decaprenyl-phosphate phosphoribosyltransferase [Candidatus Cerribacteria bacterium 'Amazon FNV 2010 28 9']|uniref:Decaprenyl-phosphate phosphoribosyltransferase n=1 Tax=Candidatus Cerribacteria bacterium 'Amazon FNV 2010 28 9' TaxID=2081795 RepID=A0A317JMG7_9BACT|nr:MAG: decaprenyl-phosphate phosphoribosyltransferase [Candidatus Cerribacteria bacterium 'Amazon FNV 2010 28 9']